MNIFAKWQRLRQVKVPVLDCGGLFTVKPDVLLMGILA